MHRHLSRVLPDRGRPAAARAAHAPDWARASMRQRSRAACIRGHATAPATLASATRSQCTPRSRRIAYTLEVLRAEVLKIEEIRETTEPLLDGQKRNSLAVVAFFAHHRHNTCVGGKRIVRGTIDLRRATCTRLRISYVVRRCCFFSSHDRRRLRLFRGCAAAHQRRVRQQADL